MRLFDLTQQYETLLASIEDSDEEINLQEELDKIEGALNEKLNSCAWMLRNLEKESEVYKEEAKRLADKAKKRANSAEKLKEYLSFCLNGQRYKTKDFDFTFRASQVVEILCEEKLPEEYLRVKTIVEPNKEKIKQDLKNNKNVPYACLHTNYNLQIK